MFDKNYRPLPHVITIKCDYPHIAYKFRQKIKSIQYEVMQIQYISKNYFIRMYLLDDGCLVCDSLNNKILCTFNYNDSWIVLKNHLTSLQKLFMYEKDCVNLKNRVEINHYQSLKRYYYGC